MANGVLLLGCILILGVFFVFFGGVLYAAGEG